MPVVSDKSLNGSDEVVKRTVGEVSARLLQGTASSAAKAGRSTPTLTRKFNNSDKQIFRATPMSSNSFRLASARKTPNESPSVKVVTSSAKKTVMNSTSEEENVTPADWDASAIDPPAVTVKDDVVKRKKILDSNYSAGGSAIRIRSSAKTGSSSSSTSRGPLKALPSAGLRNPGAASRFKGSASPAVAKRILRSSSSSCSNTSISCDDSDAFSSLYDEYLLSELVASNVRLNNKTSVKATSKDITSMWSALDILRREVVAQEKMNDELAAMNRYLHDAKENVEKVDNLTEVMEGINENVGRVSASLEGTRHNLSVVGAKVDNVVANLDAGLSRIEMSKADSEKQEKSTLSDVVDQLSNGLVIVESTVERADTILAELKTKALQEASLKLSQSQLKYMT